MKKNILFIIESMNNGGTEKIVSNITNELVNFHNVYLVISNKNNDYKINSKIKVILIEELKSKNPLIRIKGINKLKRIKKEYKINTSISFLTAYNLFNVITKVNDKIIISTRNHLSTKNESFIAKLANKYSNKHCDLNVCCSNSVAIDQINNFKALKEKTIVIENFTNLKRNSIPFNKKENIIISIGRLTKHKGHIHIINAMKYVVKKIPDAKLQILGQGEEYNYLMKVIIDNKLETNIELLGFIKNVDDYLNKVKVFVLASYYEGLSNSILEAMSLGIPVIATNSNGGNKEILIDDKDKYGILIPNFNNSNEDNTEKEKQLAKELINILKNKEEYDKYSNKALSRIKKYDKNKIIKKWLSII